MFFMAAGDNLSGENLRSRNGEREREERERRRRRRRRRRGAEEDMLAS